MGKGDPYFPLLHSRELSSFMGADGATVWLSRETASKLQSKHGSVGVHVLELRPDFISHGISQGSLMMDGREEFAFTTASRSRQMRLSRLTWQRRQKKQCRDA